MRSTKFFVPLLSIKKRLSWLHSSSKMWIKWYKGVEIVELVYGARLRFYALKGTEEQEKSADVATANLLVFSFPIHAFFDPGSTLSFVTPLVADLLPEILHVSFLVITPIGNTTRAERVYRDLLDNCS